MLHTILLLVTTCELVLLDDTVEVVLDVSTDDETILCLAVHRLSIDVVALLVVLYEPALLLKVLVLLDSLVVDLGVVLVGTCGEVDLRLDDVVERHRIALSLLACLVRV